MKDLIAPNDFTQVNNDVCGNPRYVLHFLRLADTYNDALFLAKNMAGRNFTINSSAMV